MLTAERMHRSVNGHSAPKILRESDARAAARACTRASRLTGQIRMSGGGRRPAQRRTRARELRDWPRSIRRKTQHHDDREGECEQE